MRGLMRLMRMKGVAGRIMLVVIVGGAIAVVTVVSVISGIGNAAGGGRHYADTLGEVQHKFGDSAKVVQIDADGGGVTYGVLSPDDSHVLIRSYTRTSEEGVDNGNGQLGTAYTDHTDDSQRVAAPADVRGAVVTLGQLDKGVVVMLWDRAGFPHSGSVATLRGSTWTISSGARFDGSGFHQKQ
jgi:hypothetical protein